MGGQRVSKERVAAIVTSGRQTWARMFANNWFSQSSGRWPCQPAAGLHQLTTETANARRSKNNERATTQFEGGSGERGKRYGARSIGRRPQIRGLANCGGRSRDCPWMFKRPCYFDLIRIAAWFNRNPAIISQRISKIEPSHFPLSKLPRLAPIIPRGE